MINALSTMINSPVSCYFELIGHMEMKDQRMSIIGEGGKVEGGGGKVEGARWRWVSTYI